MPVFVQFPTEGCLVEFFDASSIQIAFVIGESAGKLRLLTPNRRETKMAASRVLPWICPAPSGYASLSRDEQIKMLEQRRAIREEKARQIDVIELWNMVQGEVSCASAQWFAELMESEPDGDTVVAYAHALLACRTHFRFTPPHFEVFSAEMVAKKEEEHKKQQERDRILNEGHPFFQALWAYHTNKTQVLPTEPQAEIALRLEEVLRQRMEDPDNSDNEQLWTMLSKGLPDIPFLPIELLISWGKIPKHYNFWYDRAGYARGDTWWLKNQETVDELIKAAQNTELEVNTLPFVSIDGKSTRDIDDAFYLEKSSDGGFVLTLALACPGLAWPFNTNFDYKVLHRGTSVYLPEGDSHMLPEILGTDEYSLVAKKARPALVVRIPIDAQGMLSEECSLSVARVTLAANLRYHDCQAVLDKTATAENPALEYAALLELAKDFANVRKERRIAEGAVILDKGEPEISLHEQDGEVTVEMTAAVLPSCAQNMVAEMMIIASGAVAKWAIAHNVPLLYRTQDVALPKEFAGVWQRPEEIARIMRSMIPSLLETQPRQHAALGLPSYAPITSPLRRYADLINEVQVLTFLQHGQASFDTQGLDKLLLSLRVALDGASQIQRFRPRYWKLLYFKQHTDQAWWDGVITDENDNSVTVYLPAYDLYVRGRRRTFDERAAAGIPVKIRLGKVNPLYNEIQILESTSDDGLWEEIS